MKKLLLIGVFLPLFLACSSDDSDSGNSPTLEVTVDPINSLNVTVRWTYSGQGNTVYRILLNDEVIEENYSGNQYTFQIANEMAYQGTIFAIAQNDEETFQNFSFSTVGNDTWYGPLYYAPVESTAELPYRIVTGELTLRGDINTIISKISTLEEVGSLKLKNVDGMSNLEPFSQLKFHYGEGWINVNECDDIQGISGLQNMNGHVSGLSLYNCPQLTDLSGMEFANVGSLGFYNIPITDFSELTPPQNLELLRIRSLPNLETLNGLETIVQLDGQLTLSYLPNLVDVTGLSAMNKISGELYLYNLPQLSSIEGLNGIQKISHELKIRNTAITSFSPLSNCTSFRIENNGFVFHIQDNDQLENLDGLENVVLDPNGISDGNCGIRIEGNGLLSDFCGFSNYLLSVPGDFTYTGNIFGNAYNPTLEQIEDPGQCSL